MLPLVRQPVRQRHVSDDPSSERARAERCKTAGALNPLLTICSFRQLVATDGNGFGSF
jgi:hypothetical protein